MHAVARSLLLDPAIGLLVGGALIAASTCAAAPAEEWPEDSLLFSVSAGQDGGELASGDAAPLCFVVTCEGPCRPWQAGNRVVHFLRSGVCEHSALSLTAPGALTLRNDAGLAVWHGSPSLIGAESSLIAYDCSGSLVWEVPCFSGREGISSLGDVVHVPSYSPLDEVRRRDATGLVVDRSGEVVARFSVRSRILPTWDPSGTHFFCVSSSPSPADTLCCYSRLGERQWATSVGIDAAALSQGSAVLSAGRGVVVCVSRTWPMTETGLAAPTTRKLRAYDQHSGALLWEDEAPSNVGAVACAISSDGSTVYSLSGNGEIGVGAGMVLRSRDGRTGRILGEVLFPGSLSEGEHVKLGSLAASPDGRFVSVSVKGVGGEDEWHLAVYTRECDLVAVTDGLDAPITWWVTELSLAVQSSVETTVHTFSSY